MQTFERQEQKPSTDFNDHLRLAYQNCINAFNSWQSIGESSKGTSVYLAQAAEERFGKCVGVLDAMMSTYKFVEGKIDAEFEKDLQPRKATVKIDGWKQKCDHEDYQRCSCVTVETTVDPSPLDLFRALTKLMLKRGILVMPGSARLGRV